VAGVFDRAIKDAAARLLRGEGLKSEMKSKLLGLGLGLTLTTLGVAAVPATAAFADSTCYTGCTTPATSPPTTPTPLVTTPVVAPVEPKAAGTSLPFTGADIEGMAAIGGGALVAGGLMVRRSRRVRRAAA
jgi:hypothetical protein